MYGKWIIPKLVQSIVSDEEFMAELDMDELQYVAESVAKSEANKYIKDSILHGVMLSEEVISFVKERARESFLNGGNKRFIKIFKEEFSKAPLNVKVNISGKQKDLAGKVDKLVNVLRFMLSTYDPNTGTFAVFNDPRMVKLFRGIIEASGLDPIDFNAPAPVVKPPTSMGAQPLKMLSQRPTVAETVSNA